MEGYVGTVVKGVNFCIVSQANTCINAVGLVAEGTQHVVGFFHGLGFVEDLMVDVNDGICGNEHFFVDGRLVVQGFVLGQEHANIFWWQGGRKILIGIDVDVLECKTRIAEQLMSAWRF